MGAASAGQDCCKMTINRGPSVTLSGAVSDFGGFPIEKVGGTRSFHWVGKKLKKTAAAAASSGSSKP